MKMNKELNALERIKTYFKDNCINDWEYSKEFKYEEDLSTIAKALNDCQKLKDALWVLFLFVHSCGELVNDKGDCYLSADGMMIISAKDYELLQKTFRGVENEICSEN